MVTFAQIKQLDIDSLNQVADMWDAIGNQLMGPGEVGEGVSGGAAGALLKQIEQFPEHWTGNGAQAAADHCKRVSENIVDVAISVKKLASLIRRTASWEGADNELGLAKAKDTAQRLEAQAHEQGLTIDADGHVSWDGAWFPDFLLSEEAQRREARKEQQAEALQREVDELLTAATKTDRWVASALKVIFGTTENFETRDREHGKLDPTLNDWVTKLKFGLVSIGLDWYFGFDDANELLQHWLEGSGDPYEVDVEKMLKDMPAFREDVNKTLEKIKELPDGKFDTSTLELNDEGEPQWQDSSPRVDKYDNDGSKNWYYALNNFEYKLVGEKKDGVITYHIEIQKEYNWGVPSQYRGTLKEPIFDSDFIEQADAAKLHSTAMARDFTVHGKSDAKTIPVN
ncbi:hypothetical protein [Saccharomonospora sp. NB11]|uniref:hypothetical protein n=1 Tax=Saccharomonospora sp. NB11 TaxID=1642298 RepID=UPI0018D0DF8B|nr:hypothetical protein [Saccharomonospora sp. NB11]